MVTPNGDMYTGPRQRPTGAPVVNMPRPQSPMGMLGQGISQFAGGIGGGLLDVGRRMLSPGTSPFTGQNLQPYDPMFQPQSLPGQIGRGFVSGFTGGYPEGPVDHRKLSGLEQAFYFGDLVDPSGIAGDILRPLSKVIPEGTVASLSDIIPRGEENISSVFKRRGVPQGTGGVLPSVSPRTSTVVYTGADEPFTQFDISKIGTRTDAGFAGRGVYTTADPAKAGRWGEHVMETVIPSDSKLLPISGVSELYSKYGLKQMTPAQLDLPLVQRNLIYTKNVNAFSKKMTDQGYDGIAWTLSDGDTQYVLFNPEKYKFNPVSQAGLWTKN
jgi:hypothetical protein